MPEQKPHNNNPSWAQLFFSIMFVGMLLLPVVFSLTHASGKHSKAKTTQSPPGFNAQALLEPEFYRAWTHYTNSSLTADPVLHQVKSWIDYRLFAMTDSNEVHIGKQGWLYRKRSIQDFRKDGCRHRDKLVQLITDLTTLGHLAEASGRRFIMTVIPNKSTIYPEFVGQLPQDTDCGKSLYDLLLSEHEQTPVNGFLRLDEILKNARGGHPVFDKTSAYWNRYGAALAAKALLKAINPNAAEEEPSGNDLAELLLRPNPAPRPDDPERPNVDPTQRLSAGVIYGGPALNQILPHIMPHFERLDVISSTTLPSLHQKEDITRYETILLVVTESDLKAIDLKINALSQLLEADDVATARTDLKPEWWTALHGASVTGKEKNLSIKSMGATAFVELPELPGSDPKASRMIRLDIEAPRNDTFTWAFSDDRIQGGTRQLRQGLQTLYIPLPLQSKIRMKINTGRHPGIFKVIAPAMLTIGEDSQEAIARISIPEPKKQPSAPPEPGVEAPASVKPSIVFNEFQNKRIFQRRGKTSDVFVSGSYRGRPTAIEAMVLHHRSNKVLVPWTVVDSTPNNGIFMGVLTGVPQGGWYRMAVRFQNQTSIVEKGRSLWGVGVLVACIGQSNMKEWFFTEINETPNDLLSIHRNGRWDSSQGIGIGASTFGGQLVHSLGMPVGLLDYAVNGSGLRREADWGEGYWADRSEKGIYKKFVKGVTAAGGAVEYVLWMQGEADAARNTITENQYGHTLKALINEQIREDMANGFHGERLPFLIIGMAKRPVGRDKPHQAIRNALVAATRNIPGCHLAATTLDLKNHGRQHLTPGAYQELGLRVAQTVLYLLGESTYYRGPSLDRIRQVNATIIDIDLNHRGGNDIIPFFDITGFEVSNQDTPLAIAQVQRQTPNTIRIHLAEPASDPITVKYLYGAMPDTSSAVRDNSDLRLPLEPFVAKVESRPSAN